MGRHIKTQRRSERWKEAEKIQTAYETNKKKKIGKFCPFFFFFNGFFFLSFSHLFKNGGYKRRSFSGVGTFCVSSNGNKIYANRVTRNKVPFLFFTAIRPVLSLQWFSGITSPSQPPLPSSSRIVCVQKTFFFSWRDAVGAAKSDGRYENWTRQHFVWLFRFTEAHGCGRECYLNESIHNNFKQVENTTWNIEKSYCTSCNKAMNFNFPAIFFLKKSII